jgi:hypothetical protein
MKDTTGINMDAVNKIYNDLFTASLKLKALSGLMFRDFGPQQGIKLDEDQAIGLTYILEEIAETILTNANNIDGKEWMA